MTRQIVLVLDTPPLDADRWAGEVFARAGFTVVDRSAIKDAMVRDAPSRDALLAHADDPFAAAEVLAPFYRRAFEELYRDVPRVGAYGSSWLLYAPHVDACVIDWSEVEARATAPGVTPDDGERFRRSSMDAVHARLQRHLSAERWHELPPGLSQLDRVLAALAFLEGLDQRH